jgi:predicted nucleotidyltransferase component of viral defense system
LKEIPPKNLAASVRDRLYNLAQRDQRDFSLVLTAFATERWLYRLSCSEYADGFVLKGARLFALWSHRPHRSTRDLDLLGFGDPSPGALRQAFQAICRAEVEADGLTFDEGTMTIEEIRSDQEYNGQRIKLTARLTQARIPLQIDVGFGDVITPEVQTLDYTPLLDILPAPHIRAYPRETVIAEKLQAMVALGTLNTRMKDFYDICALADEFDYDGQTLCRAIHATFLRRKTTVPSEAPICFQTSFAEDEDRQRLWKGFLRRSAMQDLSTDDFTTVLEKMRTFLGPPLFAASQNEAVFPCAWHRGKGWRPKRPR